MPQNYEPSTGNVAARLWKILHAAQSLNGAATHQQLAKAFGLEKSDTIDLLRTLVLATETIDEVELLIRKIPNEDYDLYLHQLEHIKAGFGAAASNQAFDQWKLTYLRPENIQPLLFCANIIAKSQYEEEIKKEKLNEFLAGINELYNEMLTSEIDPQLRVIILELLEGIRRAIHDYRVKGVTALKRALASSFGELALHKDEFQQALKGKEGGKIRRFCENLAILDSLISLATKCTPLLPALVPYYPLLLEKAKHLGG